MRWLAPQPGALQRRGICRIAAVAAAAARAAGRPASFLLHPTPHAPILLLLHLGVAATLLLLQVLVVMMRVLELMLVVVVRVRAMRAVCRQHRLLLRSEPHLRHSHEEVALIGVSLAAVPFSGITLVLGGCGRQAG